MYLNAPLNILNVCVYISFPTFRYYLRFKDAYRQAVVDITQGQPVSDELMSLGSRAEVEDDTVDLVEKEENMKMLLEDCKKMLIVEPEQCLGGWSLINADPL